jgi:hypothetical protein
MKNHKYQFQLIFRLHGLLNFATEPEHGFRECRLSQGDDIKMLILCYYFNLNIGTNLWFTFATFKT